MIYMKKGLFLLFFALLCMQVTIGQTKSHHYKKKKSAKVQYGTASIYDNKFIGRKTSSGDTFSQKRLTAAHNNVPLGSWVRVTNLHNKKTVIVKVIDHLHFRNRRLIDLSRAAASALGASNKGLLNVKVEILGKTKSVAKGR